jgi:hypothetical protein
MKKIKLLILIIISAHLLSAYNNSLCSDLDFFISQLNVKCRGIAGRLIPPIKEHVCTRVLSGLSRGTCSGSQTYTSTFIKFYSSNLPEAAANEKFEKLKENLSDCMKDKGWEKVNETNIDENNHIIRWQSEMASNTRALILQQKPIEDSTDADLYIITVELVSMPE